MTDVTSTALRAGPRWRAVLAQTAMELRLLVRSGESLIVTFGIPLGMLAFFGTVDVLPTGGRDAVDFLVPGVLALSVAATGLVAVAIQTAFERKYGVLKRLGTTPLSRSGFVLAKSLAVSALLVVQVTLVLLLAMGVFGWRSAGGALSVPVVLVLGAGVFTSLGLLLAGTLRAEGTLAASNALFLVLLVVSGVVVESDALPDALAAVGAALPVGLLGGALRHAVDGGGLALGSTLGLAAWGVGATLLTVRTFRWEP